MLQFVLLLAIVPGLGANAAPLRPQEKVSSPPPNILFAIADDWGLHAGAYGTRWVKTPHFDRVARDGILFQNAYTPDAKCAPSRACILTGRNSWQLKEAANHLCYFPSEFKGWPEALNENGWFMGHTTKGWGPGVAINSQGKNRQMTGQPFNARKAAPATNGIGNSDYAANFEDFLNAAPPGAPWAFWYGAIEPHRGYEFGSGVAKGGKKLTDIDRVPRFWPDNETVRHDMLDYALEVEHFDAHLGRMLASLEKRGLLENTLVVVTSDHGMPFPRGKGGAYEYSNHVPLAMMWPKGIMGKERIVHDFVSFIDLAPTFLEYAGIPWERSGLAEPSGKSLGDIFRSAKSGRIHPSRDHVLIGMERHDIGRPNDVGYPIRGIVNDHYLYLKNYEPSRWPACNPETGYLNVDGGATKTWILAEHRKNPSDPFWVFCFGKRPSEELYNLKNDPDCVVNLARSDSHKELRDKLSVQMVSELKAQGDPRMFGKGDIFDQYPHANKAHVHFYERYRKGEKMRTDWVNPEDFEKEIID